MFQRHSAASVESSSGDLLKRARGGDSRAFSALFKRQKQALERWTRGRLPRWARNLVDTNDLVQEALLQTFRRIEQFDDRGQGALQAYLREAVRNRIRDELRRVERCPAGQELPDALHDPEPSPFDAAVDSERARRYKSALLELNESERLLVVGRLEMGYTYEQLALIGGRVTAEAARLAVRRAVIKLARHMTS
jgi:RNA polymerase sigma factor (sigma-70 family)